VWFHDSNYAWYDYWEEQKIPCRAHLSLARLTNSPDFFFLPLCHRCSFTTEKWLEVAKWKVVPTRLLPSQNNQRWLLLLAFWITFYLILYMFFGWLHQGGLVLSRNESATQSPRAFMYYKIYTPPTFLTRGRIYTARKDSVCEASEVDSVEETCSDDLQHQTELFLISRVKIRGYC